MLETTNQFFDRAADHLELSDQLRTMLVTPNRVTRVEIITEADDGNLLLYTGYRVQRSNARGSMKGSFRSSDDGQGSRWQPGDPHSLLQPMVGTRRLSCQ